MKFDFEAERVFNSVIEAFCSQIFDEVWKSFDRS